ncbi:unnamed protein product [Owenia fusiformis]|uniref:DNA topoisomerase n=1 Tax=Owenia fusiformis TaxID=6347 RepID=A0A8J1XU50_OWEFU|nr:unnamed protein product [Owenia fusiformis]
MKTVLMVAEKPSLAQSLAKILSNGQMGSRKGTNGACSIHEYNGKFQGESVRFKFTSVCGHVMSLDFIGKYNNWDRVDPAELFSAPTLKKEATEKLHMPKFLEKEARGSDYLVLWLDCDKEGENICFEVMDACKPVMNPSRGKEQTIFRAHFSAITETDIKRAMSNLGSPNQNEALSVDARQELDLRVGCAFTRYQTKFFQGKYGDLDSTLISYGPCQTPTLGFCVERHDKIQSFKPEPFWVLQALITIEANRSLTLDWDRVRMFDKDVAQMFLNVVKGIDKAVVTSVTKKEKVKQRPLALNTVEMLKMASTGLGMSPQHTMQIAERLYTQGYISYPRTETTHYPDKFDLRGTLQQQLSNTSWGQSVNDLLAQGINRPRKGHDAGDHPPITPMRAASEAELGSENWRLYDFITRHFIATVSSDCKYLQTTAHFKIGQEKFSCTGKSLIDPGYTGLMTWQAITQDEKMPVFTEGQSLPIEEAKLVERQTSPPDYLTEAELIGLMEKHGIGTDASIAVHINNICERNYVNVGGGRRLRPTPLGIVLVHGYQKIDPELVLPSMRSAIETQLNLIASGKADFHAVTNHVKMIFSQKFKYFVSNIVGMDELFEVTFSSLASSGKPLSRCGKCRRFMKFIQAKPSRLHCPQCDETYSLPQNGAIKLYKELKCPLDDFELVISSTGSKGKSYPLCPYCYNNPPFREMRKGMGCNECTHPTCGHALQQFGVALCPECENGILVLDPNSAPKWKMACNNSKCNVVVNFFDNAHRVAVSEEMCEECGTAILDVTFNKTKTPLTDGATEHSGCPFCDVILKPLVELKHASLRMRGFNRNRASRGRGRGRGGRGRGRGGRVPKDKMSQLAAYFV